jgi:outer membrane protein OmpA-like peptidoglycan-associated protein
MPASTPSASKTLAWLLAIVLIGVVALYDWHNANQAEVLAGKDAQIAQSAELFSAKEQELGHARAAEQGLRLEMDALNTRHDNEKRELAGKLDAAHEANRALQADMEALKTRDAQTLAAEQEKAKQAYVALQGQLDSAGQQILSLGAELEQLKSSMADTAAAHEARMAQTRSEHEARTLQLEQQLNEKISYYRTALEGSDPERAAQLAGLELQMQSGQQALEKSRRALEAMQEKEASLGQQLADANRVIVARDQAMTDANQKLEALDSELTRTQSDLSALQQEHDTAVARAGEELAATRQQLQVAESDHARAKADATAAIQEAEGRISDLDARLQAETAALIALQRKHESEVTELSGSLDATKRSLAQTEAELSSAKGAAVQAQQAHEKQVAEVRAKVSDLEDKLAQTQQKAAQDLAAGRRERQEAVEYVRGVYTEFSKLGGRYTDRGMLLSLAEEELRFRISQADLPEGELPSLDWIAELLLKHPKLTARIEGHTDSKGREETNLELSQQRADAVKQALIDRGVPAERVVTEGIGAARPIADNATSAGRRENRRVEIYVIED